MLRNRLFNVLIAIALVLVVALTVREAFATTEIASGQNSTDRSKVSTCAILPSRLSIHTDYVHERGMWVTSTAQGPTGVDGGLMELLFTYPICSR